MPKMTVEATKEGRRSVGRPRIRWRDKLAKDLLELGVENPHNRWMEVARNRGTWRGLVRSANGVVVV